MLNFLRLKILAAFCEEVIIIVRKLEKLTARLALGSAGIGFINPAALLKVDAPSVFCWLYVKKISTSNKDFATTPKNPIAALSSVFL